MSFLKVIMADDEPGILELLATILKGFEGAKLVGKAENANDTIKLARSRHPDLAFLDIGLPDMNGIELAERLREINPNIIIVFITAHKDYSLDAFKVYALDYILKPIDEERVKSTFKRILKGATISGNGTPSFPLTTPRLSINLGNELVFVRLNDIQYIEKDGRYTVIHCVNGKFKTRQTLQELKKKLGAGFFRSHKSFIINTEHLERIVNYANSSCYEIKFKNSENRALLSRDRIHDLMLYAGHII
ncbi:LytR/AlgR family response regulator transcription factor [Desulfitibacter alkalitolerans]|uniref:LytR/AlgR family response regulator transcription factor n=1 Tax=Desulfitibacter alkalitolerans TaxID=264641 RepID=UPI00047FDE5C|nr:LytTR family DNA-binding domain-containing protein [Desulfitibacter alkalitolerans]